jgi:hypothetical protein
MRNERSSKSRRWQHGAIVEYQGIDRSEARDRFAQRSRRQAPAVPQPARIEHHEFDIARQPVMLQAVVGKDHVAVRMGGEQGAAGGRAIPTDKHRTLAVARQQQCLVTKDFRRSRHWHLLRMRCAAPVAAGDHAGAATLFPQSTCQVDDQWSLAATAHRNIADHHNRYRQSGGGQQSVTVRRTTQLGK